MIGIYPGSFDPITYGHIDIIERASRLCEQLIIVIMPNDTKESLFTPQERLDMIEHCVSSLENVRVEIGSGLTVEYAKKIGAQVMIRGVRAVSDYEYEVQLASANMAIGKEVETLFLLTRPEFSYLSSSTAKTIAENNGDLTCFVDDYVAGKLKEKFQ